MIDTSTKQPVKLRRGTGPGGFFRIPTSQLEEVQSLFDRQGIRYWLSDRIFSFNGGPEMTTVYISQNANADEVQALLDQIP